jgi:hypothetical protein
MILPVNIETLMWLLPIILMFHGLEEIIMFKPWLTTNRRALEKPFTNAGWAWQAIHLCFYPCSSRGIYRAFRIDPAGG